MTRVVLKWQSDETHPEPYEEEVVLGKADSLSSSTDTCEYNVEDFSESLQDSLPSVPESALGHLEREGAAAALQECLEQLIIVRQLVDAEARPAWTRLLKYQSLEDKLELTGESLEEFFQHEYEKIPYTDPKKFLKDLYVVVAAVREGTREMVAEGTFQKVGQVVETLKRERDEYGEVEEETRESEKIVKELAKTMVNENGKFEVKLEDLLRNIAETEIKVEHLNFWGKQEMRYVKEWEDARAWQQDLVLSDKQDTVNDLIEGYRIRMEYEMRIFSEWERWLHEEIEELNNQIEHWMMKYDSMLEKIEFEIVLLRGQWDAKIEERRVVEETLRKHQEEMEAWVKLREELRLIAEQEQREREAAVILQRWWRGMLVRKCIGKFKWLKAEIAERKLFLKELAAKEAEKNKKKKK